MIGSNHTETSMMSDDSEMDLEDQEEVRYRRKYLLLLDRCESIQQDNERLVYRYFQMKCRLRLSLMLNYQVSKSTKINSAQKKRSEISPRTVGLFRG